MLRIVSNASKNNYKWFKFANENTRKEMENMIMDKHNQKLKIINQWLDKSAKSITLDDQESWKEVNEVLAQLKKNDSEMRQMQSITKKYKKELDKQEEKEIIQQFIDSKANEESEDVDEIPAPTQKSEQKQKTQFKVNKENPKAQKPSQQSLPEHLQVRCLRSKQMDNQILMFGVNRTSLQHAQYIHDAIHSLKPEVIISQLPPDLPLFIRTENNYQEAWQHFLQGDYDAKFYVSPNPKFLQDIMFNKPKIENFIKNTILKSNDFQLASIGILENSSDYLGEYMLDIMKMPFTYCFNNPNRNIQIVLGGYPELLYRDHIAKNTSFEFLYGLYKQKREAQASEQKHFDPFLLASDALIKPRVNYEVEVLKKCFLSYKTSICIVDNNSIDLLEEGWQNVDLTQQVRDLSSLLEKKGQNIKIQAYIKNMVLMDLLTYPLINNNFARYKYIPPHSDASDLNSLTHRKQAHVIWEHWWHKIKSLKLTQKDMEERINADTQQI